MLNRVFKYSLKLFTAIVPNYLKLTLNYLHVLTEYDPHLHATLYFKI
ncbi:hypothetical protein [Helicobacter pylori]|nr:hypothetical protein [Helicobacter pylori]